MSDRIMVLNPDGEAVQLAGTGAGEALVQEASAADILAAAAVILVAVQDVLKASIAGEDLATNRLLVEQRAEQYAALSGSAKVCDGPGRVFSIIPTAGDTDSTIKLWGNTSAADPVLLDTCKVVPGVPIPLPAVVFTLGLYATLAGTGTKVSIFYTGG